MCRQVVKILGFCYYPFSSLVCGKVFIYMCLGALSENIMSDDKKESLWYRIWDHRTLKEKQRLRSFVPYILYGIAVFYGIIYLSILNTINRERVGTTVKTWFGGDTEEIIKARAREEKEIKDSFKGLRKRVSGGR